MRNKKARYIRKTINNIIPVTNVVGMNVYRRTKRSLSRKEVPESIDFIIDRYESLFNRMHMAKLIKHKRLNSL
jgi:hypothetical protein